MATLRDGNLYFGLEGNQTVVYAVTQSWSQSLPLPGQVDSNIASGLLLVYRRFHLIDIAEHQNGLAYGFD